MEQVIYKSISTTVRKLILHQVFIKGHTYPQEVTESLKISKGLPSQFLKLCNSLKIVDRIRKGRKVWYSLNNKGRILLKRMCPEIFDRNFIENVKKLPYKKLKRSNLSFKNIIYSIDKEVDILGGAVYKLHNKDDNETIVVHMSNKGDYWCTSCLSMDCVHIQYIIDYAR